ncbi:MAG: hypothetical protein ACI8X5_002435 [Planctomycetota bacterium]|jgi:hypothetical protein
MLDRLLATVLFVFALAIIAPPSSAYSSPQTAEEDLEAAYRSNLERRIGRHPYFKKIGALDWVWDYDDFVILVQKPQVVEPGYVAKVAKFASAQSQAMNGEFSAGLAEKYGIRLRVSSPRMMIVVLATQADFNNYFSLILGAKPGGSTSYYSESDRLLLLRQTPFQKNGAPQGDFRVLELQTRASQILHAYSSSSLALPGPYWLQQGLVQEIMGGNERERAKKSAGRAADWNFHKLCSDIQNKDARGIKFLPLMSLLTQTGFGSVGVESTKLATAAGLKPLHPWYANQSFNAFAGAFYHYLSFEAGDELGAKMSAFTEASMKGKLQTNPFKKHFADVNWLAVEKDFWKYIWRTHSAQSAGEKIKAGEFLTFLGERAGKEKGALATEGSVEPSDLLEFLQSVDERLALAIAAANTGDSARAEALLSEALARTELDAGDKSRLELELFRVRTWTALRDKYIQELVSSGKKLNVEVGPKRLLAVVTKYEEGTLTLAKNARNIETLEVKDIEPAQLARKMSEKRSGFTADWSVAYPLVIDREVDAAHWLKGDAPELEKLARDNSSDYPARCASVSAAMAVLILVQEVSSELSQDERGKLSAQRLQQVNVCWAQHKKAAFVERIKPSLQALAQIELGVQFDHLELADQLAGKVETLNDGRIRIRYDLSSASQLKDWPLDPAPRFHEGWGDCKLSPSMEINQGILIARGPVSRSHVLAFEGPHSLVWREKVILGDRLDPNKTLAYRVGLCSLPDGSIAGAVNSLNFEIRDVESNEFLQTKAPENNSRFDTSYVNELVHDGSSTLTLRRNSEDVHNVRVGARLSGHPQFWFHTDYAVEIDEIEVVGKVTEASLRGLRQLWVTERVTAMGLSGN